MPFQNREQIRAQHALDFKHKVENKEVKATGKEGGAAMTKIPAMIMANGLLAVIAFAIEERKKRGGASGEMEARSEGHRAIFDAIAEHLASAEIHITPGVKDASTLIDYLTKADSATLMLATDESLAWLGYARRFISGGNEDTVEIGELSE